MPFPVVNTLSALLVAAPRAAITRGRVKPSGRILWLVCVSCAASGDVANQAVNNQPAASIHGPGLQCAASLTIGPALNLALDTAFTTIPSETWKSTWLPSTTSVSAPPNPTALTSKD